MRCLCVRVTGLVGAACGTDATSCTSTLGREPWCAAAIVRTCINGLASRLTTSPNMLLWRRGTAGALAGGAAHQATTHWQPNSHKSSLGPLPPFPFVLPPEYDAALQHQYGVVTELRSKIKGSGLDEAGKGQLQVRRGVGAGGAVPALGEPA